jgi:hypothetical protein
VVRHAHEEPARGHQVKVGDKQGEDAARQVGDVARKHSRAATIAGNKIGVSIVGYGGGVWLV